MGLPHLLYLPGLLAGAVAVPSLLSVGFAALLGLSVTGFCSRFFDRETASLALPLLWSSPVLLLVAVTPRVDTTLAFFLFVVHDLVVLAWKRRDGAQRTLAAAALALELAVGVKLLALAYGAMLVPLVVWLLWPDSDGLRLLKSAAGLTAMVVVGAAP